MRIRLVDPHAPAWGAELDRMGLLLRRDSGDGVAEPRSAAEPNQPGALPPYHFLFTTLPRIGGGAAWLLDENERPLGAGFLFPHGRTADGRRRFIFRYHLIPGAAPNTATLCSALRVALAEAEVELYNAGDSHTYAGSEEQVGPVNVGRPSATEAAAVPALHQAIWQSPPEFIYPADLHSVEFGAGTSLVARVEGQMVGFLLGFHKFGGDRLPAEWQRLLHAETRIESQIMGVLPAYRGLRIAALLKQKQAALAWRAGVGIVNWTADPLQYPNAALNLGLLRAVAFGFAPDLYPFRNALNRVHASRLTLSWLVGSRRVREAAAVGSRAQVLELTPKSGVLQVNEGLRIRTLQAETPLIAIEIPANWTRLQEEHVAEAQRWREVTDRIFARYVGLGEGQYVLTGVAVRGEQRFLVGEQSSAALFAHLIQGVASGEDEEAG